MSLFISCFIVNIVRCSLLQYYHLIDISNMWLVTILSTTSTNTQIQLSLNLIFEFYLFSLILWLKIIIACVIVAVPLKKIPAVRQPLGSKSINNIKNKSKQPKVRVFNFSTWYYNLIFFLSHSCKDLIFFMKFNTHKIIKQNKFDLKLVDIIC